MRHVARMVGRGAITPVLLAVGLLAAVGAPAQEKGAPWTEWAAQSYRLQPGESVQFRVAFAEIPVRSWRLQVEGELEQRCDLQVTRVRDAASVHWRQGETRHDVTVPWGRDEELIAVLTAPAGGVFAVRYLGPPPEAAQAAYSYEVNRALESYAAGRRLEAEGFCEAALARDSGDAVARVLLAGFLRDRHFYERATEMIEAALAGDLPPDMRDLAVTLQEELAQLQAPLPRALREGLDRVGTLLARGDAAEALGLCDALLADHESARPEALSRIQRDRGRALHALGRNFEAVDAYTRALTEARSREAEAVIYYRMGCLFLDMDNLGQAEGAFSIARKYGLPPGLDLQAAEALERIARRR
jgi:hypothetical protein